MSDDAVDPILPDPVVQTALQLLPVPDHGPDFWTRLDASLAVDGAAPVTALADRRPGRVGTARATVPLVELERAPATGVVPAAMRRPSNVVLSAVAVAAAVMVVLAGTSLVRSRTGDDPATEVAEAPDGSSTTDATEASHTTLRAPDDDPATKAVVQWINALSAGDMDAAWSALGPASKTQWGSQAAFEAERSGFAEGYGAWASAAPEEVLVMSLTSSGDGELLVVTFIGTVDQEGTKVARADAFPVRVAGGKAVIELYAFAGEMELVVPEPVDEDGQRPVVATDEELVVVVPEGAAAPVLRLDDGATLVCGEAPGTELTPLEDSPGQRCGYTPAGGIPAGERVLTVAFTTPDGSAVSARSVRFQAA